MMNHFYINNIEFQNHYFIFKEKLSLQINPDENNLFQNFSY